MNGMDPTVMLSRLLDLTRETEWVEWKGNDYWPEEIGE